MTLTNSKLNIAIIAPGVPEVMQEFGSTSDVLSAMVVSIYVIGVRISFSFGLVDGSSDTQSGIDICSWHVDRFSSRHSPKSMVAS